MNDKIFEQEIYIQPFALYVLPPLILSSTYNHLYSHDNLSSNPTHFYQNDQTQFYIF